MIVDQLRAASAFFRDMSQGAQIIRVPWEVCPLTHDQDGKLLLSWKGFPEHLIPRAKENDQVIDTSWWKPPFNSMIVVSEKEERGCLYILWGGVDCDPVLKGTAKIDGEWSVLVAQIGLNDSGEVICLLATNFISMGGRLADVAGDAEGAPVVMSHDGCDEGQRVDYRAWATARMNASLLLGQDLIHTERQEDPKKFELELFEGLIDLWRKEPRGHRLDVENIAATFATTCAMMCCKNIIVEKVTPPVSRQQRRALERKGLPLVSWHILKIKPHARHVATGGVDCEGQGQPLAMHWVRGHYKHYTKEKPLLGRAVGTWWWSPHLAGRDPERVVLKDYEIETEG